MATTRVIYDTIRQKAINVVQSAVDLTKDIQSHSKTTLSDQSELLRGQARDLVKYIQDNALYSDGTTTPEIELNDRLARCGVLLQYIIDKLISNVISIHANEPTGDPNKLQEQRSQLSKEVKNIVGCAESLFVKE